MEIFNLILEAVTKLGIAYPTPRYKNEIVEYIKNKRPSSSPEEVDGALLLYWHC
jgi:hypothetical protein